MFNIIKETISLCFPCLSISTSNKKVPLSDLPEELFQLIFSYYADFKTLQSICLVNKQWKHLLENSNSYKRFVYEKLAFNSQKWNVYFGDGTTNEESLEEEFNSLPDHIFEILKSPCQAFPGKKIGETHILVRIPRRINSQPLTLDSFKTLVNSCENVKKMYNGYGYVSSSLSKIVSKESVKRSQWILMTKDILPKSKNTSYEQKQLLIQQLSMKTLNSYEMPDALEASVCIWIYNLATETPIFGFNPPIYTSTRSNEAASNNISSNICVGGFYKPRGIYIDQFYMTEYGTAALMKLE